MGRVDGKVVFITGLARGQGRAHAVRLAEEGADIIGVDICADVATNDYPMSSAADLEETVRLVEKLDRRIVVSQVDVRDRQAVVAAVNSGVSELGRLDAVVANAGICPLGTQDPQAYFDSVQIDFVGVVNAIEAGLAHIVDGGSIVATGSLAALLANSVDAPGAGYGGLGYAWAKRGVASLVHDLAFVLGARRIRVNAVHPTNCNTDLLNNDLMYKIFRPDLEAPTREDALEAFPVFSSMNVPYVEPLDIANAVLFLVSDESRYVTGMQLRVDAGGYVKSRPLPPQF
jgi:SDR family mycofactocin-dependent oxidoreductase